MVRSRSKEVKKERPHKINQGKGKTERDRETKKLTERKQREGKAKKKKKRPRAVKNRAEQAPNANGRVLQFTITHITSYILLRP